MLYPTELRAANPTGVRRQHAHQAEWTTVGSLVGARGFEPPTSCSQSKHSTRLSYAPRTGKYTLKQGGLSRRDGDDGLPDRIRTCDPQLRRLMLYPAELRTGAARQDASVIVTPVTPRARDPHPSPRTQPYATLLRLVPSRSYWALPRAIWSPASAARSAAVYW